MLSTLKKDEIVNLAIEVVIKLVVLGVILFYAFEIIRPFIIPVIWGIIIAVTFSPVLNHLEKKFRIKRSILISIFTLIAILALVVPTYLLSDSVISSSTKLVQHLKEGTLKITPPNESVKQWPLIGEIVYERWSAAASDFESTLLKFQPKVRQYAGSIVSGIGSALGGILQFVVSLIIAAVFLGKSEGSVKLYHAISKRLIGEKGVQWAELSALTIRSVVQGVIGIAMIQAILSFIGMVIIGVPFSWLWAFLVLFLAIIQLPTIIVLGPVIAYVYSYTDPTWATVFAIYSLLVGVSDNFLKPLMLGRGVDIPMLVILLGAIGGMILSGILGLFVGAVGLALAYKLFITWLEEEPQA
ncbi:MAG TPA: AI-2E family transporter [Sulfurimonas sp.]|nr:AI-2E family transporter [Sulfurimonas sp.]